MVVVGLTGGIGSGKSTVAGLLASRGAHVVDADAVAREVVAPGTAGHRAVVARFGPQVVGPDGHLDRRALAAVVFDDGDQRAALNEIVHPAVRAAIAQRLEELAAAGSGVVVLEIPLLVESGRSYGESMVVVVDCPEEVALARLMEGRGMDEADARRRMAAQLSRAERRAAADVVVDNSGDRGDLELQVSSLWATIVSGLS